MKLEIRKQENENKQFNNLTIRGTVAKFILLILIVLPSFCFAQRDTIPDSIKYPKGTFIFPIMPGKQNYLTGTFAELRRNHFHGGLDIRTNSTEGLPVIAIADGYISKIVVSGSSYGNHLYMNHFNGYQSLYAHLKSFNKKIHDYTRESQYKLEKNEVELKCPPRMFRFRKGDTIAFSGNTGASAGPHLHFEIRDKYGNGVNPLLFNFDEIKDKVKPIISKMAIKTFDMNSRVNDKFGRFEFGLNDDNNPYSEIFASGVIGFEINTWDLLSGASNHVGIYQIELYVDSQLIFHYDVEKVNIAQTRQINCHTDYAVSSTRGSFFQKCYIEDGNKLNTYLTSDSALRGKVMINEERIYTINIRVIDYHRNLSEMNFKIMGVKKLIEHNELSQINLITGTNTILNYSLWENLLKIETEKKSLLKNPLYMFFPYKDDMFKEELLAKFENIEVDIDVAKGGGSSDDDEAIPVVENEDDDSEEEDYNSISGPEYHLPQFVFKDSILDHGRKIFYTIIDEPSYFEENKSIFLYDLRYAIPDSFSCGRAKKIFKINKMIYPEMKNFFSSDNIQVMIPVHTFNDTLYLEYIPKKNKEDKLISEFKFNDYFTPVYKEFFIRMKVDTLKFKPEKTAGFSYKGWYKFEQSQWKKNVISFKTKTLGTYKLMTDDVKPIINPVATSYMKNLRFTISDGLSGIKAFRATVDDKWILLIWDAKYKLLYTDPNDENIPTHGEFVLELWDNLNNKAVYKKTF